MRTACSENRFPLSVDGSQSLAGCGERSGARGSGHCCCSSLTQNQAAVFRRPANGTAFPGADSDPGRRDAFAPRTNQGRSPSVPVRRQRGAATPHQASEQQLASAGRQDAREAEGGRRRRPKKPRGPPLGLAGEVAPVRPQDTRLNTETAREGAAPLQAWPPQHQGRPQRNPRRRARGLTHLSGLLLLFLLVPVFLLLLLVLLRLCLLGGQPCLRRHLLHRQRRQRGQQPQPPSSRGERGRGGHCEPPPQQRPMHPWLGETTPPSVHRVRLEESCTSQRAPRPPSGKTNKLHLPAYIAAGPRDTGVGGALSASRMHRGGAPRSSSCAGAEPVGPVGKAAGPRPRGRRRRLGLCRGAGGVRPFSGRAGVLLGDLPRGPSGGALSAAPRQGRLSPPRLGLWFTGVLG